MSNPRAPVGCASVTATSRTDAYDGPWRHHSTIASTAVASPSTCAATEPSGSLRTQPATPRRAASCTAYHRNDTPCTRPVTLSVTAFTDSSQDRAGDVRRGLGMTRDQTLDPAHDRPGLRACGAG